MDPIEPALPCSSSAASAEQVSIRRMEASRELAGPQPARVCCQRILMPGITTTTGRHTT